MADQPVRIDDIRKQIRELKASLGNLDIALWDHSKRIIALECIGLELTTALESTGHRKDIVRKALLLIDGIDLSPEMIKAHGIAQEGD